MQVAEAARTITAPAAPSGSGACFRAQLLDLPDKLLTRLLSPQHCSKEASCAAAGTCRALRQASLEGVTNIRVRCQSAVRTLAFASSLPSLQRLAWTHLDATFDGTGLPELGALTNLREFDLEGIAVRGAAGSPLLAASFPAALTKLTSLRRVRLVHCAVSDAGALPCAATDTSAAQQALMCLLYCCTEIILRTTAKFSNPVSFPQDICVYMR